MTEPTTKPTGHAEFLTAFATGWPEDKPDLIILSLSTHSGKRDYAISKDQALLIAKTLKDTAANLGKPKPSAS